MSNKLGALPQIGIGALTRKQWIGGPDITHEKTDTGATADYLRWLAGRLAPIGAGQFARGGEEGLAGLAGVQITGQTKEQREANKKKKKKRGSPIEEGTE